LQQNRYFASSEIINFKGKQFKKDVIIVAVGYYLRYNLSYREVQELLYDRGINAELHDSLDCNAGSNQQRQ
jgi:transposase-like protein